MTKVVTESWDEKPERSRDAATGSSCCPRTECQTVTADEEAIGPQRSQLMQEVLRRENLLRALKRVPANKGTSGINGMSVNRLPEYLREHWPEITKQRLLGWGLLSLQQMQRELTRVT
ncbi:MAG: hypothetical protein JXA30_21135 [Deltaproteobacteria bacterium]|nr:hypothetical protein [Deltaproteobacteria bacterium]